MYIASWSISMTLGKENNINRSLPRTSPKYFLFWLLHVTWMPWAGMLLIRVFTSFVVFYTKWRKNKLKSLADVLCTIAKAIWHECCFWFVARFWKHIWKSFNLLQVKMSKWSPERWIETQRLIHLTKNLAAHLRMALFIHKTGLSHPTPENKNILQTITYKSLVQRI